AREASSASATSTNPDALAAAWIAAPDIFDFTHLDLAFRAPTETWPPSLPATFRSEQRLTSAQLTEVILDADQRLPIALTADDPAPATLHETVRAAARARLATLSRPTLAIA